MLCVSCFCLSGKMESLTLKDSKPEEEEEQKETFIAFARVYSGVVKKGQRVFVLGPKYDPAQGLSMVNPQLRTNLSSSHFTLLSFVCLAFSSVCNGQICCEFTSFRHRNVNKLDVAVCVYQMANSFLRPGNTELPQLQNISCFYRTCRFSMISFGLFHTYSLGELAQTKEINDPLFPGVSCVHAD